MDRNQESELLDRVPPSDWKLERQVIGMMLIDSKTIPVVKGMLNQKAFHDQRAARWFAMILGAWEHYGGLDVALLVTWAREHEGRDAIYQEMGGTVYLHGAMNEAGLSGLAKHYCKVLIDHATRRRVIGLACKMLVAAYGCEIPVSELVERTRKAVEYLRQGEIAREK